MAWVVTVLHLCLPLLSIPLIPPRFMQAMARRAALTRVQTAALRGPPSITACRALRSGRWSRLLPQFTPQRTTALSRPQTQEPAGRMQTLVYGTRTFVLLWATLPIQQFYLQELVEVFPRMLLLPN